MSSPRYCVGIDLGTTHSCLAYVEFGDGLTPNPVEVLPVPQLVREGEVESRTLLPSFAYLPPDGERHPGAHRLPWQNDDADVITGALARDRGAEIPSRLVASAKSWLCHGGADRTGPILPWEAPAGIPRISPVEAAAHYLGHLRSAWNQEMAGENPSLALEHQSVVLTVPASFDAVARDLTLRAAHKAGLGEVVLLEEPQAALYAWISEQGEAWRHHLEIGERLLVVDVGGGTTDLSLIETIEHEGQLALERVAVGEHILLGGDNMDLALAHSAAPRLGAAVDRWQMQRLVHGARRAKETLLENPEAGPQPVTVVGRGSGLIASTLRTQIDIDEVRHVLLDGFLPRCGAGEFPQVSLGGLMEVGLPYAHDAAITRHLAAFIGHNGAPPTRILFNGGVMTSPALRQRVIEVLDSWFPGKPIQALKPGRMHDAVARGAAYYSAVRRGRGVRIRGGTARSYYIGVEASRPAVPGIPAPLLAVCVAPQGMEEGTDQALPGRRFAAVVGNPVQFRFFASTQRPEDQAGETLETWTSGELSELSPIVATLGKASHDAESPPGPPQVVPVTLHCSITELGTLELYLSVESPAADGGDGGERWKLGFNVRERAE